MLPKVVMLPIKLTNSPNTWITQGTAQISLPIILAFGTTSVPMFHSQAICSQTFPGR